MPLRTLMFSKRPGSTHLHKTVVFVLLAAFNLPTFTWAFDPVLYSTVPATAPVMFQGKPLQIPQTFATTTKQFQGQKGMVVHIQDIHCNYGVQTNIASILDYLVKNAGLATVMVEGASQPINLTLLSTFPDATLKKQVGDFFLKQGKISGAEYYAACGENPLRLRGLETQNLYTESQTLVKYFLNDECQGMIQEVRDVFEQLKNRVYAKELKAYDKAKTQCRDGQMPITKFSALLCATATTYQVNLSPYPTLRDYAESKEPSLFKAKEVDAEQLQLDIRRVDQAVRQKMYQSQAERNLDKALHQLDVLERLFSISALPEEVKDFQENYDEYTTAALLELLRQVNPQEDTTWDEEDVQLDKYLEKIQAFYELVDERSDAFVANTISTLNGESVPLTVIITGGFHTELVLKRLEEKGIGYISLLPTRPPSDVINPYFALLQGRKLPVEILLEQNQKIFALPTLFPQTPKPDQPLSEAEERQQPDQVRTFMKWVRFEFLQYQVLKLAHHGSALSTALLALDTAPNRYPYGGRMHIDWKKAKLQGQTQLLPFQELPLTALITPKKSVDTRSEVELSRAELPDTDKTLLLYDVQTASKEYARLTQVRTATQAGRRVLSIPTSLSLLGSFPGARVAHLVSPLITGTQSMPQTVQSMVRPEPALTTKTVANMGALLGDAGEALLDKLVGGARVLAMMGKTVGSMSEAAAHKLALDKLWELQSRVEEPLDTFDSAWGPEVRDRIGHWLGIAKTQVKDPAQRLKLDAIDPQKMEIIILKKGAKRPANADLEKLGVFNIRGKIYMLEEVYERIVDVDYQSAILLHEALECQGFSHQETESIIEAATTYTNEDLIRRAELTSLSRDQLPVLQPILEEQQERILDATEFHHGDVYPGKGHVGKKLDKTFLKKVKLGPAFAYRMSNGNDIYFSQLYNARDGRQAVMAYVKDIHGKLVARTYYRSNSQGVWRYLPNVEVDKKGELGWFAKGYKEDSVTLPFELQQALEVMLHKPSLTLSWENSDFAFSGTVRIFKNQAEYFARYQKTGTFGTEVLKSAVKPIKDYASYKKEPDTNTEPKDARHHRVFTGVDQGTPVRFVESENGEFRYCDEYFRPFVGAFDRVTGLKITPDPTVADDAEDPTSVSRIDRNGNIHTYSKNRKITYVHKPLKWYQTDYKPAAKPENIQLQDPDDAPVMDTVIKEYSQTTSVYGKVKVRVFESKNHKLLFSFMEDDQGRAWIGSVETQEPVTSLGLKKKWVQSEPLTTPVYEYVSQSNGYGTPDDYAGEGREYISVWENYVSKIPYVKSYSEQFIYPELAHKLLAKGVIPEELEKYLANAADATLSAEAKLTIETFKKAHHVTPAGMTFVLTKAKEISKGITDAETERLRLARVEAERLERIRREQEEQRRMEAVDTHGALLTLVVSQSATATTPILYQKAALLGEKGEAILKRVVDNVAAALQSGLLIGDLAVNLFTQQRLKPVTLEDHDATRSQAVRTRLAAFLDPLKKQTSNPRLAAAAAKLDPAKLPIKILKVIPHSLPVDQDLAKLGVFSLNGTTYITEATFKHLQDNDKLAAVVLHEALEIAELTHDEAVQGVKLATNFENDYLIAQAHLSEPAAEDPRRFSTALTTLTPEASAAVLGKTTIEKGGSGDQKLTTAQLSAWHLGPNYQATLTSGQPIYYSSPFNTKSGQLAIIAYLTDGKGGFVPRTYYLSKSQSVWRYLPAAELDPKNNPWIDKGYTEDSVTLPLQLQLQLKEVAKNQPVTLTPEQRLAAQIGTAFVYLKTDDLAKKERAKASGAYQDEVTSRGEMLLNAGATRKDKPKTKEDMLDLGKAMFEGMYLNTQCRFWASQNDKFIHHQMNELVGIQLGLGKSGPRARVLTDPMDDPDLKTMNIMKQSDQITFWSRNKRLFYTFRYTPEAMSMPAVIPEHVDIDESHYDDRPDFRHVVSEYTQENPMYGQVKVRVISSVNGKYWYSFMEEAQGRRVWIGSIEKANGQPQTTGLKRDWVYGGVLTTPLFEYVHQSMGWGTAREYHGTANEYISMWDRFLSKIPMIREYREHFVYPALVGSTDTDATIKKQYYIDNVGMDFIAKQRQRLKAHKRKGSDQEDTEETTTVTVAQPIEMTEATVSEPELTEALDSPKRLRLGPKDKAELDSEASVKPFGLLLGAEGNNIIERALIAAAKTLQPGISIGDLAVAVFNQQKLLQVSLQEHAALRDMSLRYQVGEYALKLRQSSTDPQVQAALSQIDFAKLPVKVLKTLPRNVPIDEDVARLGVFNLGGTVYILESAFNRVRNNEELAAIIFHEALEIAGLTHDASVNAIKAATATESFPGYENDYLIAQAGLTTQYLRQPWPQRLGTATAQKAAQVVQQVQAVTRAAHLWLQKYFGANRSSGAQGTGSGTSFQTDQQSIVTQLSTGIPVRPSRLDETQPTRQETLPSQRLTQPTAKGSAGSAPTMGFETEFAAPIIKAQSSEAVDLEVETPGARGENQPRVQKTTATQPTWGFANESVRLKQPLMIRMLMTFFETLLYSARSNTLRGRLGQTSARAITPLMAGALILSQSIFGLWMNTPVAQALPVTQESPRLETLRRAFTLPDAAIARQYNVKQIRFEALSEKQFGSWFKRLLNGNFMGTYRENGNPNDHKQWATIYVPEKLLQTVLFPLPEDDGTITTRVQIMLYLAKAFLLAVVVEHQAQRYFQETQASQTTEWWDRHLTFSDDEEDTLVHQDLYQPGLPADQWYRINHGKLGIHSGELVRLTNVYLQEAANLTRSSSMTGKEWLQAVLNQHLDAGAEPSLAGTLRALAQTQQLQAPSGVQNTLIALAQETATLEGSKQRMVSTALAHMLLGRADDTTTPQRPAEVSTESQTVSLMAMPEANQQLLRSVDAALEQIKDQTSAVGLRQRLEIIKRIIKSTQGKALGEWAQLETTDAANLVGELAYLYQGTAAEISPIGEDLSKRVHGLSTGTVRGETVDEQTMAMPVVYEITAPMENALSVSTFNPQQLASDISLQAYQGAIQPIISDVKGIKPWLYKLAHHGAKMTSGFLMPRFLLTVDPKAYLQSSVAGMETSGPLIQQLINAQTPLGQAYLNYALHSRQPRQERAFIKTMLRLLKREATALDVARSTQGSEQIQPQIQTHTAQMAAFSELVRRMQVLESVEMGRWQLPTGYADQRLFGPGVLFRGGSKAVLGAYFDLLMPLPVKVDENKLEFQRRKAFRSAASAA